MNSPQKQNKYQDFLDSIKNEDYVLFVEATDGMTASYASSMYFNNETQEPVPVVPVWSTKYRQQAIDALNQNWKGCSLLEVPIAAFISEILPEMAKSCIFLGINIDEKEEQDVEVDPLDVFKDLGLLDETTDSHDDSTNDN